MPEHSTCWADALPVCFWPSAGEHLPLFHGQPIVPVADRLGWEQLRLLTRIHGCEVVFVRPDGTRHRSELDGGGMVLGLGAHTELAASVYAFLTRRRYRIETARSPVTPDCCPDVVLLCAADWVDPVKEFVLSSQSCTGRPGVVVASSPRQLLNGAVKVAVAARIGRPQTQILRAVVAPGLDLDVVANEFGAIAGRRASIGEIRRLISEYRDMVVLATHSDGLDALLNGEAILCPMPGGNGRFPEGIPMTSAPACVMERRCLRRGHIASGPRKLVGPEIFATKILFANSCLYARTSSPAVLHDTLLGVRTMDVATFGCLIASPGIFSSSITDLGRTIDMVVGAGTAGKAIMALSRSSECTHLGRDLILFGDPEYTYGAENAALPPAVEQQPPIVTDAARSHEVKDWHLRHIEYLWVGKERRGWSSEVLRAAVLRLKHNFVSCFRAARSGDSGGYGQALADCLAVLANPSAHYAGTDIRVERTRRSCPNCGGPIKEFILYLPEVQTRRHQDVCDHCALLTDRPPENRAGVWRDGEKLLFEGIEPSDLIRIRVTRRGWPEETGAIYSMDGHNEASFMLPTPLFRGWSEIIVVVVSGLSFSLFRFPMFWS